MTDFKVGDEVRAAVPAGRLRPRMETPEMSIADVETLTRYIIAAGGKRCALCWKGLPAGTAAFTDPEGFVVCATCALHCAICNDPEHDHPRYVHADAED